MLNFNHDIGVGGVQLYPSNDYTIYYYNNRIYHFLLLQNLKIFCLYSYILLMRKFLKLNLSSPKYFIYTILNKISSRLARFVYA
jgi:hypothetical protein